MSDLKSILLFGGRLARLPYGLVALPILAIFECRYLIVYYWPVVFDRFNAGLTSAGWLIVIYALYDLLLLPLLMVSFSRLRDIGLTGFLALPYLLAPFLKLASTWAWMHHASPGMTLILDRAASGVHIYGLALAVLLLLVPGRKAAPMDAAVA